MKISETIKSAAEILRTAKIDEAIREAKSLLAFALNKNQTFLIAHSEYELSVEEENRFQSFIKRRANREPFQYIVGRQEFYGLDFAVTEDVLIPRPETEMIVEAAIEFLLNKKNSSFCEVGIGSGCIALSILNSMIMSSAIGLDISEKALKIAEMNAKTHQVSERLELRMSDIFDSLSDEKFDLIVSNPPYISSEAMKNLQPEVRDFEPINALTDGKDGFSIIEKIIETAPRFLLKKGILLMEIGYNQSLSVEKMFDPNRWQKVEVLPDLQGIPRTVRAELK